MTPRDARIVERRGTVEHLHSLAMPSADDPADPELWVMRPTGPAVVRGSSQKPELFDDVSLTEAGVALTGRRSGGAAVWIEPAGVVWIDVLASRDSLLWSTELAETFLRVGRCWQRAFRRLGIETELVDYKPERGGPGDLACWAGHGWGEVLVEGFKIVGLSQRRTRWGARVQCMAVVDGSAAAIADAFVGLAEADRVELREAIGRPRLELDRAEVERIATEELLRGL